MSCCCGSNGPGTIGDIVKEVMIMCCSKKCLAEFIGTFWLVLGGCGTAVLAGEKVGWLGVALAFGLTVLTMAYAIGPISGCHLNPAVSIGCFTAGRMKFCECVAYIIVQILGAILAAYVLSQILVHGGKELGDFAANGYGDHSPGGFDKTAAILAEGIGTFIFLIVILGATARKAFAGLAGVAIGLCLTLIHLITIPVTNTSVNPARSISQAVFVKDWAIDQLPLFIIVPICGAIVAGIVWRFFEAGCSDKIEGEAKEECCCKKAD